MYRLPTPRSGSILGLVGTNGIGKTTALQILTNKIKPNLGRIDEEVTNKEILNRFKGSEIHNYLEKLNREEFKSAFKVQFVDKIPKMVKGNVGKILDFKNQRPEVFEDLVKIM